LQNESIHQYHIYFSLSSIFCLSILCPSISPLRGRSVWICQEVFFFIATHAYLLLYYSAKREPFNRIDQPGQRGGRAEVHP
jgi:hypothetical protein